MADNNFFEQENYRTNSYTMDMQNLSDESFDKSKYYESSQRNPVADSPSKYAPKGDEFQFMTTSPSHTGLCNLCFLQVFFSHK